VLNDSPFLNTGEVKYFETVVVVVDTGEVLGSLSWNIQRWEGGFCSGVPEPLAWTKSAHIHDRAQRVCTPGASRISMPCYSVIMPSTRRRYVSGWSGASPVIRKPQRKYASFLGSSDESPLPSVGEVREQCRQVKDFPFALSLSKVIEKSYTSDR